MAKRGKCRCGAILRFELTAQGYKTRCASCQSIVRLRMDEQPVKNAKKAFRARVTPPPTPEPSEPPDLELEIPTDFSTPPLMESSNPDDLRVFSEHESDAPRALADWPAYSDVDPDESIGSFWWLAGAGLLVLTVGAGAALMFWL